MFNENNYFFVTELHKYTNTVNFIFLMMEL